MCRKLPLQQGVLLDLRRKRTLRHTTVALAYSGGPDAAALAAKLKDMGANVLPVYVSYRAGRGGKTAKDLQAARRSAELLGLPITLIDNPLVRRITSELKPTRNRLILQAISETLGADAQAVGLGTFQESFEADGQWTAESNEDLDPAVLAAVVSKNGHKLITWDSFGKTSKADTLGCLPADSRAGIFATISCQMWWRVECGNCYSCRERHAAFLSAFNCDPTLYKPNSTVGKES